MQVASGKPFDSKDYMAATPSWAVYGADEGGFDPDQSRYRKERHHKTNHWSTRLEIRISIEIKNSDT